MGKIRILAKLHRTDLVICSHSGEVKTPSYSQINTVRLMCLFYGTYYTVTCCYIKHLNSFHPKPKAEKIVLH